MATNCSKNPQKARSTANRDSRMKTPCRRPSCGGYPNMKISADPTTFKAKPVNCSILNGTGPALLDRNTANPVERECQR
jgi:hypothetical protein